PRRHRRKQQHHAEKLGPRELYPEVSGETEVGERLRHLRQAQLRVGGKAYLQTEERGDHPIEDGYSFWRGVGPDDGRLLQGRFHEALPPSLPTDRLVMSSPGAGLSCGLADATGAAPLSDAASIFVVSAPPGVRRHLRPAVG